MHAIRSHRLGLAGLAAALLLSLGAVLLARGSVRPESNPTTGSKLSILAVKRALVHFQTDNAQRCPPSVDTLVDEHYLVRAPLDAWQRPLRFACPGAHDSEGADVISAGHDGLFDTADDLRSWEL